MRKIIFFELNEVPFRVFDEFCHKNPHSALAKIRPYCHEYTTYSEDSGLLEPWITWPSVHRGVSNQQHGIHDYNQNITKIDEQFPPVWSILNSYKVKTGVFSSLHSYPLPQNFSDYAFFIPDPFAPESKCYPQKVSSFQEFNLMMSRISGKNVSSKLLFKPAVKMVLGARSLGLRPSSFTDVGKQLLHEFIDPKTVIRRRAYQSVLAFDVFMNLIETHGPQFCTFFTNHVASSMHRYWGATFPEDCNGDECVSSSWKESYRNEINFTMRKFDGFLKRLIAYIERNKEYKLIILGSMGQASTKAYPVESIVLVKDAKRLMSAFNLEQEDWAIFPAMVPQFNFSICEPKRNYFRKALASFKIDNREVDFRENESGFFSIDFSFGDIQNNHVQIMNSTRTLEEVGLSSEPLQDKISNTGWHVPEGAMLIYDGQEIKGNKKQKVSILAICPSILDNFSIDVPPYMIGDRVSEILD